MRLQELFKKQGAALLTGERLTWSLPVSTNC